MVKARALYDNHSETADELSFLRDDVLEIIEKDYDGMEGWWLCGLRGKTGIAPANRLVIITINEATGDYDLPPTKYGSFPTGKKPLIPTRDCATEDYDTPSNRYTGALKQNDRLQKESPSKVKASSNDEREYDDYCVPTNGDDPSPSGSLRDSSPNEQRASFERYFSSYLRSEREMNIISMRVAGMMKTWYDCPDPGSRARIVKAVCVSHWKSIQAYVSEAAKTISSIKRLVTPEIFKSFEEVKRSGQDLESVLDHLNRFHELSAEEKTKIEFLQRLSALNSNLTEHSKLLTDFFSRMEKDGSWMGPVDGPRFDPVVCKNLNLLIAQNSARHSYGDYDTPPSKLKNIPAENLRLSSSDMSRVRKVGGRSKTVEEASISLRSDLNHSFEDYDVPRGSDTSESRVKAASDIFRPASSEFLDYDCPKASQTTLFARNKSTESLDETDYDVPQSETSLSKVESSEAVRIRKRSELFPNSDSRKIDSKSNVHLSFDGLDYDIPKGKPEIDSTQRYLSRMGRKERSLLAYYHPFVSDELHNLTTLIGLFQARLEPGAEPRQPLRLINDVKSLASCSHKVLFIIDSVLKRVRSDVDLNNQLNFSCSKICEHLKNITNLVKVVSQAQSSPPSSSSSPSPSEKSLASAVSEFQLHVRSIARMVSHWK